MHNFLAAKDWFGAEWIWSMHGDVQVSGSEHMQDPLQKKEKMQMIFFVLEWGAGGTMRGCGGVASQADTEKCRCIQETAANISFRSTRVLCFSPIGSLRVCVFLIILSGVFQAAPGSYQTVCRGPLEPRKHFDNCREHVWQTPDSVFI